MRVKLYLTSEGQETLANGGLIQSWHYSVIHEGKDPHHENSVKIGETVVSYPAREACVLQAMEALKLLEQKL